jgi:predicted ATPase
LAAMVGRETELRRLRDVFDQAVGDGSCQLVTVLGAAGVGKSRLVAEFASGVGEARMARGRCLSYGEGITYWPLAEALSQLPDPRELGLDAHVVDAIAAIGGSASQPGGSTEEIAWAVGKLLERIAAERPIVVALEDIHWAEPTLLDVVEHVVDLSRGASVLVVCTARPELLERRSGWAGGKFNATSLLLEPLSSGETDELMAHLTGGDALDERHRARITEAAEGNPLFVEEMVALVRESGVDQVGAPPTISALLAARLDQLEPADRGLLEQASVEGRVFHVGGLAATAGGGSEPDVLARLAGLVRKELIRPDRGQLEGEDAFRFRHALIRDAAYDAIPKARRAVLHERFAGWLERRTDGRDLGELVGFHLERAYRYRIETETLDAASEVLAARGGDPARRGRASCARPWRSHRRRERAGARWRARPRG